MRIHVCAAATIALFALHAGAQVLLASIDPSLDADGAVLVPSDATVWARFTA